MKNKILTATENFIYGILILILSLGFWMNAMKISSILWNIILAILLVVTGMVSAWIHEKKTKKGFI